MKDVGHINNQEITVYISKKNIEKLMQNIHDTNQQFYF